MSAQAEDGRNDAEAIDRVTDRAIDALADQRVQRRTQGQRQVVAISEVGQRHADKGKHAPAMQAPVQKQQLHALTRGLSRTAFALRRLQQVRQWL